MAKASDNLFPSVLINPGAAPAAPASGERIFLDSADGNKLKRIDSSGTVVPIEGGAGPTYSTYTPVLTASATAPSLGTGGLAEGRYFQQGKHVVADLLFKFGSSGISVGSGNYYVSLPVAARESAAGDYLQYARGFGYVYHASSSDYRAVTATRISATTCDLLIAGGATKCGSTLPWGWGAGDALIVHLDYEAA